MNEQFYSSHYHEGKMCHNFVDFNHHINYSFLGRAPAWIKKMLELITGSDKKGPVFRFFMDLGDAGKRRGSSD